MNWLLIVNIMLVNEGEKLLADIYSKGGRIDRD